MKNYKYIAQKPYCCVAACVEIILDVEGLSSIDQEDIAYELGLIVPEKELSKVRRARTGERPKPGWGTQIHENAYSLTSFFFKHKLPLSEKVIRFSEITSPDHLGQIIRDTIAGEGHILACFNYPKLYGLSGSWGHASLVMNFDNNAVTLRDPSEKYPEPREVDVDSFYKSLRSVTDAQWGIWIIERSTNS